MVNRSRTVLSHFIVRTVPALVAIAVVACGQSDADVANGDDPMEALASPILSVRYNATYWNQTSVGDKELWEEAVAFCDDIEDPRNYPNCEVVRSVAAVDRMAQPREDQPDTFSLVPKPFQDTTPVR